MTDEIAPMDSGPLVPLDKLGRQVIRAEYLPGAKWRIISFGNTEVERGLNWREAREILGDHLDEAGFPPPPPLFCEES